MQVLKGIRVIPEENCLCCMDQNFQVPQQILKRMLEDGYATISYNFSLTEKGEARLKEIEADKSIDRPVTVTSDDHFWGIDEIVLAELIRRGA